MIACAIGSASIIFAIMSRCTIEVRRAPLMQLQESLLVTGGAALPAEMEEVIMPRTKLCSSAIAALCYVLAIGELLQLWLDAAEWPRALRAIAFLTIGIATEIEAGSECTAAFEALVARPSARAFCECIRSCSGPLASHSGTRIADATRVGLQRGLAMGGLGVRRLHGAIGGRHRTRLRRRPAATCARPIAASAHAGCLAPSQNPLLVLDAGHAGALSSDYRQARRPSERRQPSLH